MMVNSITTKIGEHSLHCSEVLTFFAQVHRRLVLQILEKRNMDDNLVLLVDDRLGYLKDLLDYFSILAQLMQNCVTARQNVVTEMLNLLVVNEINA